MLLGLNEVTKQLDANQFADLTNFIAVAERIHLPIDKLYG